MTETTQCAIKDCPHDAAWQIGFKGWALGYPKTSPAVEGWFALGVCNEHMDAEARKDVLSKEGCAMINNQMARMHKREIDFSKAEIQFRPVIDGELPTP